MQPTLGYCTIQAGADTFVPDKITRVLDQYIDSEDTVLNTCAGETTIQADEIRNDIDDKKPADYHVDCREISSEVDQSVDVVLHDPPFSLHQATHTWDLDPEQWPGYMPVHREVQSLLEDGGYLIQAGFSAVPVAAEVRDCYDRQAIVVCNQLGRQDDWILTVDEKTSESGSERPWDASADVVPNGEVGATGDFDITYRAVPGTVSADDIWTALRERAVGETLLLDWQGDISPSKFGVSEPVERYRSVEQLVRYVGLGSERTPTPPAELDSVLPETQPDTVVVWPHQTASNVTTRYAGDEIGFIRAIKQELDQHFGSGITVLLVGNTATGMRRQWDYGHVGVTIADGENPDSAWYITEFEKTQKGLGEVTETTTLYPGGQITDIFESPADNLHCNDGLTAGRWIVDSPRIALEQHPALYYHCPVCGAAGDNLCVDTGEGNWSVLTDGQTVHEQRCEYAKKQIAATESVRVYDGGNYLGEVKHQQREAVSTPSKTTLSTPSTGSKQERSGTQMRLGNIQG